MIRHPIPVVPTSYVFDRAPWLIYWEITRACDLACRHCRAEAIAHRDPLELTLDEGKALLDSIRQFGDPPPHLVITGGDPLRRPDLPELVSYALRIGINVSLSPSVTPLLTREALVQMRTLGVETISLSLDGADAALHDRIRGIPGCFDRTLEMVRTAVDEGLQLQINTLVTAETLADLPRIYQRVVDLGALRWSLFFLIQVGRGTTLQPITPSQAEDVCRWLTELIPQAPLQIKTTEAPFFRRVAIQQLLARGLSFTDVRRLPMARGFGVRDGNGILFISHRGDVYPSGFLPVAAGNVRNLDTRSIYRDSQLFRQLRDVNRLKGKCGRCEFRHVCGGSRARAYVATGDPMESDPLCAYEPR